jgi:hypothetical protein
MDRDNSLRTKSSTSLCALQIYIRSRKCATSTTASSLIMRIAEITNTSKPATPQQQRMTTLKQQAKRSQKAVKQERLRQQQQKLNQQRSTLKK